MSDNLDDQYGDYEDPPLLGGFANYQEAVDLGRTADWWQAKSERLEEALGSLKRRHEAECDRLAARVQALEEALRAIGDKELVFEEGYATPLDVCKATQKFARAALAAQPDHRTDMGSRADNYKDQEPPHVRGA